MKKTSLCITGSFGNRDIGDEAMLTETLDFLVTNLNLSRDSIHLFGYQPDYMAWYHEHPLKNCHLDAHLRQLTRRFMEYDEFNHRRIRKKAKEFVKRCLRLLPTNAEIQKVKEIIEQCDGLIVTGGGTINTREQQGVSVHRMAGLTRCFSKMGKPIFFCAQTIGPLGIYPDHDALAKEIVLSADYLFARDKLYSRRYLDVLGAIPEHFIETYDDAASLPYENETLPADVVAFSSGEKPIALNVTFYTADTNEKRSFIARLAESLIQVFDSNLIFVSHTPWDYATLLSIFDMLPNSLKGRVLVPDVRSWRDKQLKKLISSCRLAIGGRYHYLVFAGTSNTPFVGMCGTHYSYIKNDGFARIFGYENFVLSEKDTWDMCAVLSCSRQALETIFDIRSQIKRPSPTMQNLEEWLRKNVP